MTLPTTRNAPAKALTPSLPAQEPPQPLTRTEHVPGYRHEMWLAHPIAENERGAVEAYRNHAAARLAPARPVRVIELLFARANHNKKDRTPDEWTALFHDYVEDLREFGEGIIADAIREHRRQHGWFPSIADLRALCEGATARERVLHRRARVLLGEEAPYAMERPRERQDADVIQLSPERRAKLKAEVEKLPSGLRETVLAILPGEESA